MSAGVLIAADSAGRREVIVEMLSAHGRRPRALHGWEQFAAGDARLAICVAEDVAGLALAQPPLLLLGESQLFGTRARQERRRRRSARRIRPRSCAICRVSSPAPRWSTKTYGVGRYVGLQLMEIGDQSGEFLALEYRDGDRVYVPVHALHWSIATPAAPRERAAAQARYRPMGARAPAGRRGGA